MSAVRRCGTTPAPSGGVLVSDRRHSLEDVFVGRLRVRRRGPFRTWQEDAEAYDRLVRQPTRRLARPRATGQSGLTEEAAARALDISEAILCRYRDGQEPVPRSVILALERLVGTRTKG